VTITRPSVLAAVFAAAAAQAQRRYPNWKPRLGVLCQYTDSNLEFIKAEGFTSMQLRLDPARLDDAAREKQNEHTNGRTNLSRFRAVLNADLLKLNTLLQN
jgi:hypothetical protein